jgi:competence transcription factor ComK
VKEGDSNLFRRETTTINSQAIKIVTDIASFFFTLQSSAFWHFKMPKQRRLMTVNKKN